MKKYRCMLSAGMSAVLTRSDVASQRPHWLAGAGGFESQMSVPKLAFEVWPEFPFISQRLAIRDFSRRSCPKSDLHPSPVHSAMNIARRSLLRCGQAMLERRLLWIREFESSRPSHTIFRSCSLSSVLVRHNLENFQKVLPPCLWIFANGRLQPRNLTVSMTVFRVGNVRLSEAEIPSCL